MATLRPPTEPNYRVQYDEQGRPFLEYPGRPRTYISPQAMGDVSEEDMLHPEKAASILDPTAWHRPPQWNQKTGEYETPVDWNKLLT